MTMSDDSEWAARPCLREWTLRDRPCPWFTCGRDCEDTWADEAGAAFAAIRVAALAVLSALAVYTASAFYASRTDRLLRGVAERWNALEHLSLLACFAVVAQVACWADLDGYGRVYWAGSNYFLWHLVRFILELALFRVCDTYRQALESMLRRQQASSRHVGTPSAATGRARTPHWHARHGRTDGGARLVAASCAVGAVTAGVTLAQSLLPATKRRGARGACWDVRLNSCYVLLVSMVELGFLGDVLYRSSRVRGALLRASASSARTRHATNAIYRRIQNLGVLFALILAYALFVVYRNRGTVACFQPPCGRGVAAWVGPPILVIAATCLGCLAIKRPRSPARVLAGLRHLMTHRLVEQLPTASTADVGPVPARGTAKRAAPSGSPQARLSTRGSAVSAGTARLTAASSWAPARSSAPSSSASSETDFPSPLRDPIGFEMAVHEGWLGAGLELGCSPETSLKSAATLQSGASWGSRTVADGASPAASEHKTVGWADAPGLTDDSAAGTSNSNRSDARTEEKAGLKEDATSAAETI